MAEVVGPLQEADEYQQLQVERQRGVYNILTGLPGFLFILPGIISLASFRAGFPSAARVGWSMGLQLACWVLFFLSCFSHRLLLPVIRRHRPDWESALLESSLVKRALDKQFWLQIPFFYAFTLLIPFASAFAILFRGNDSASGLNPFVLAAMAVVHLAAMATLAFQARKAQDKPVEWLYWLGATFVTVTVFAPLDQPLQGLRYAVGAMLLGVALVTPPITAGMVRLLAPRRWLVR